MGAMATGSGRKGLRADINVTPLVDVVLVLLIIFMVITPLLRASHVVQLPAARTAARGSAVREPVVLTIAADRSLWLQDEPLPDGELAALLSAGAEKPSLLIRADSALSMRDLRPLLRKIKDAGLHQIAFAVAPKQGAR